MRTIKFRVWDKKKKEFIAGYKLLGGFNLFGEYMLLEGFDIKNWNNLEIMQYTGLKANGKEIYESDIVIAQPHIVIIKWHEEEAKFDFWDYVNEEWHEELTSLSYEEIEIIGNIYENKDLL